MFPQTMMFVHHHPKSVDVDKFIARRERRRFLKKKVASVFKPFHFHHHHHKDHQEGITDPEPLQHANPIQEDESRSGDGVATSSSGSSTGVMSEVHSDDFVVELDTQLPELLVMEESESEASHSSDELEEICRETVTAILSASVVYAIATQPMPSPEDDEAADEVPVIGCTILPKALQNEIATHYESRPESPNLKHPLSQELMSDIANGRPAGARIVHLLADVKQPLSDDLMAEIANHYESRPERPSLKHPLSQALMWDIADSQARQPAGVRIVHRLADVKQPLSDNLMAEIEHFSWPAKEQEQQQSPSAVVLANSNQGEEDFAALKTKCANLATITELLSKQLVESTLTKKREHASQRKESKMYRDLLKQMQAKHRAEMANWQSDKRHLEEKLRYNYTTGGSSSVPPSFPTKSVRFADAEDAKEKGQNIKKRPQQCFLDSFIAPMELCVSPSSSPTKMLQPAGPAFSMASTMIMQNRFLPAMLSAVAHANSAAASSPKKL